jgi:hypothetical protein
MSQIGLTVNQWVVTTKSRCGWMRQSTRLRDEFYKTEEAMIKGFVNS